MDITSGENFFSPQHGGIFGSSKKVRSYYEILEVSPNANRAEIRRAYIRLKGSYSNSHGASYSLLEPGNLDSFFREIEVAYRALDDDIERKRYDFELFGKTTGEMQVNVISSDLPKEQSNLLRKRLMPRRKVAFGAESEQAKEKVAEIIAKNEEFNGQVLKQIREAVGVGYSELEDYLKISRSYIIGLEEEEFSNLPPLVYVRGFLKSLLEYLGVEDGSLIIEGYSRNYTEWKKKIVKKKF